MNWKKGPSNSRSFIYFGIKRKVKVVSVVEGDLWWKTLHSKRVYLIQDNIILNGSHIDEESLLHAYTFKMLPQILKLKEYVIKNLDQIKFFVVFRSRYTQNRYVEVCIIGWDIATLYTKEAHLHMWTNLGEFLWSFKLKLCSCGVHDLLHHTKSCGFSLDVGFGTSRKYELISKVKPYLPSNISLAWPIKESIWWKFERLP